VTKVWVGLYICTNAAYGDADVVAISCDIDTVKDAVRDHILNENKDVLDLKDFDWVSGDDGELTFTNFNGTDYKISQEVIQ
jgi:hypothetical protein